jgi:hypothetical protein
MRFSLLRDMVLLTSLSLLLLLEGCYGALSNGHGIATF